MTKKIQDDKKINPLPVGIKFSIFDKSKNKAGFVKTELVGQHSEVLSNTPQFRISQHKGA